MDLSGELTGRCDNQRLGPVVLGFDISGNHLLEDGQHEGGGLTGACLS